jgi:hypothetical protein
LGQYLCGFEAGKCLAQTNVIGEDDALMGVRDKEPDGLSLVFTRWVFDIEKNSLCAVLWSGWGDRPHVHVLREAVTVDCLDRIAGPRPTAVHVVPTHAWN